MAALVALLGAIVFRSHRPRYSTQADSASNSAPAVERIASVEGSIDAPRKVVAETEPAIPAAYIEPATAAKPAATVRRRGRNREPQMLIPPPTAEVLPPEATERLPVVVQESRIPHSRPNGVRAGPIADPEIQQASAIQPEELPPGPQAEDIASVFPTIEVTPIDLASALGMVDVQNPEFLLAQTRVLEAVALRQLAAAQFLPNINAGTSYDGHTGNLQQSNGNILSVKRNSLTVGAGVYAVAAGSVNIPGVVWYQNPSTVLFGYLSSRQIVAQRQFATQAERNDVGLRVVQAYLDLLEADGRRSIYLQSYAEASELAGITEAYASTGQGRPADANRAATERLDRHALVVTTEGEGLIASARLAQLLGVDPSLRLHPTDNWVVPHSIVPDPIPLPELLTIALLQRPELRERQAAIREALLGLNSQRLLPFSPMVYVGGSADEFGGGSNLVAQPVGTDTFARGADRFGSFASRVDFDAMAYWTLRNIGLGNRAQINAAASRLRSADWQRLGVVEDVRMQVANAYARTQARLAQIQTSEEAVLAARDSWNEDLIRVRGLEGLPIEAVDSLRNFARARLAYLTAILEYNRAQFELYVALGQPPADALVRPAGPNATELRSPPTPKAPAGDKEARP
jgi:outer membrane protein TolC